MGIITRIKKAIMANGTATHKAQLRYVDTGERAISAQIYQKGNEKLSYADREKILVQCMTAEDMLLFPELPYDLRCPLQKYNNPNAHAFAYMDLTPTNIKVAKNHLMMLANLIEEHSSFIPNIPNDVCLDTSKVVFRPYSKNYGYTRLMCTPKTLSGKLSSRPLTLSYMSRIDSRPYEVLGEIKYSSSGEIVKASATIHLETSGPSPHQVWMFSFMNVNGHLIISDVKSSAYGKSLQTVFKANREE